MFRASLVTAFSLLAMSATAVLADGSPDLIKAAAKQLKQSSEGTSRALVSRTGSLVYNVTINRKSGAPAAPFYCTAYAYHAGACLISGSSGCTFYEEYEIERQVQATGSGNTYTCSVRLNYNFPKADSADYLWPTIAVSHRNTTSAFAAAEGYSWRSIKPILMPSAAVTTFNVTVDE